MPVVFRVGTDDRVFTVAGTADRTATAATAARRCEAELSTPFGVLPDAAGGFYISDVDANVVRYVDAARHHQHRRRHRRARLHRRRRARHRGAARPGPSRLQFGPDGDLYFCETKNHVIRRLRPDGTIDTVAGTGARGYSGDGGPATPAQLDTPYDLRFAPNGDLYVADTGNNVIRRIDTTRHHHHRRRQRRAGLRRRRRPGARLPRCAAPRR